MGVKVVTYRPGDVQTVHGTLRLTFGALAEIIDVFEADTPRVLADRLRQIQPAEAHILLTALLRPCGDASCTSSLSDADVAALMPSAATCIANAFVRPE